MAPTEMQENVAADEKANFECHKTRKVDVFVCIKCGKAFHHSCASRDWKNKVKIVDQTRVICSEHQSEYLAGNEDAAKQIQFQKRIISELEEKNRILQENCDLWRKLAQELENRWKMGAQENINQVNKQPEQQKMLKEKKSKQNLEKSGDTPVEESIGKQDAIEVANANKGKEELNSKDMTEDGFTTVITKKQRQNRRDEKQVAGNKKPYPKIKKDIKYGACENSGDFQAARKDSQNNKIWLFISKVKNTVTEDTVRNYIMKQTKSSLEDIHVKLCIPKHEIAKRRFMIGVNPEYKDLVYSTEFWPRGVAFERFNFGLGRNFLDGGQPTIGPQKQ